MKTQVDVYIALAEPMLLRLDGELEFSSDAPTVPDLPWHRGAGKDYTEARASVQQWWLEYRAVYLFGYVFNMFYSLTPLVDSCAHLARGLVRAARASPGSVHTKASIHETRLLHDEILQLMRASLTETSPCWGNRRVLEKVSESAAAMNTMLALAMSAAELLVRQG